MVALRLLPLPLTIVTVIAGINDIRIDSFLGATLSTFLISRAVLTVCFGAVSLDYEDWIHGKM